MARVRTRRASRAGPELVAVRTFPLVPLGIAMVVALVAESFRTGADLQDDVEGLV